VRLNRELVAIMREPDTKERLMVLGAEPAPDTPEAFGAYIKQEMVKWGEVVRKAGLHAD
jgi:tripartite-type tricarboxylate transporter receptor subunit TctC